MTQSDTWYRALLGLIGTLDENRAIVAAENAVLKAPESEHVTVTHNICHVSEDWVAAIERGLVFIGRAIDEDRQFIRSNGEVQPIEKVRHISRESVQHLSRHSDMITREQKEEDIIPDKLYTVERLNDYTVYENKFLYALLLRIKDFVGYRYEAIMRAYRTYRGEFSSEKRVVTATRRFRYQVNFTDEQDDVFGATADKDCASYLDRMEKIQASVAFYLRTPLMVEVSRVDKIKTKITKTNVLRMDKNFREAVTLYEFLLAYEGDGYTIESTQNKLDTISEEVGRDFAIASLLQAFLVYEHGLGVEDYLKSEFEAEEARRAELAQQALVEAIRELKKRAGEKEGDMERYMLLLEERNAALEEDRVRLVEARAEIEKLNAQIEEHIRLEEQLNGEIEELNEANAALEEEKERLEEEHRAKIAEMQREAEEREKQHAEEKARMQREHAEELARAEKAKREELLLAEKTKREEIARIKAEWEAKLKERQAQLDEQTGQTADAKRGLAAAEKEREIALARLTAVRRECGLLTEADDFTSEEGFNALEHEFEVLGMLVREKWTDVKRILKQEFKDSIRATVKGKKGQKSKEYTELSEEVRARREREEPKPEEPKAEEPKEEPKIEEKIPEEPQEAVREVPEEPKAEESQAAEGEGEKLAAKPAAKKPAAKKTTAEKTTAAKPAAKKPAAKKQPKQESDVTENAEGNDEGGANKE